MIRTIFAMAVTALVFAAVSGTSQAAPIAPLSPGVSANETGNLTQVRWWGHRHRHCWMGRFGRVHCW
jgi:hypothetical protein